MKMVSKQDKNDHMALDKLDCSVRPINNNFIINRSRIELITHSGDIFKRQVSKESWVVR